MAGQYQFNFNPSDLQKFEEEFSRQRVQEEVKVDCGYSISHAGNALVKYKVQLAPSLRARSIIPGTMACTVSYIRLSSWI